MNKKLLFVLIVYIVILTTASGVIISFINRDIQDEQIEAASQKVSSLLEDARAKANQSFMKFILETD